MTAVHGAGPALVRWRMLAVVSLGIIALTLNWFDVATAFPLIGAQFKVGLGPLSFLISLYIVGYGLAHIPGGILATAIGMKKTTLVLGITGAVFSAGAALALYGWLYVQRATSWRTSRTSFGAGWVFLAVVSFTFALIGLAGRNPAAAANRRVAGTPAPVQL